MKKVLLTLMFIPIIGWGQDIALVKLVSSETYYHQHEDCSSPESTIKLVFQSANKDDEFDDKITRKLVLSYDIELGDSMYSFNHWNLLVGCSFYIEYKDTQFIGIVY